MNRLFEIYQGNKVSRFDQNDLPLMIGTHQEAEIRLVSGPAEIAYIGESRGHLFLQPTENGPVVYHNDEQVQGSVWLKSGDTTRIDDILLQWRFSGERLEVHLNKVQGVFEQPQQEEPIDRPLTGPPAEHYVLMPPQKPPQSILRNKILIACLFLLLLGSAAYVLLAKPLSIKISPNPEAIDISGGLTVSKFGEGYLGVTGKYFLQAKKEGYKPLLEEIEIPGFGDSYHFSMVELPGLIDLTTTPAGASLRINGNAIGVTPLEGIEVNPGAQTLRIDLSRYKPIETTVEVPEQAKRQKLHFALEPNWSVYKLQTEPEGAEIQVDGVSQGITPVELELLAGSHLLLFTKDKHSPLETSLTVEAGVETVQRTYKLKLAPATLALSSNPVGAKVSVNNNYLGRTPLTTTLPSGEKLTLSLFLPGHLPAERTLNLDPGERSQATFQLEPEYGTLYISSTPPSAILTIDGTVRKSSNGRFRLTTRPHQIELKADGYESLVKQVTPQSGYSQRIELVLSSKHQGTTKENTAGSPETVTTPLGQKLVLIKPQTFTMGASRNEPGRRANEAERIINLEKPFYISRFEVTNMEFRRFHKEHSSGSIGTLSLDAGSYPVVNVSWDDAARFMNWLSAQDGLPPFYQEVGGKMIAAKGKGTGYRLPSEAEWAYAARMAGRQEPARYAWPGKFPPTTKQGNYADESAKTLLPVIISGYSDGYTATSPVGSFQANPTGIHDLDGNVAEWCHDFYSAVPSKDSKDPLGPENGTHHLIRGSSWRDASITELRFSYRRYGKAPANDVGFRIARYAE